jgi:hypothetical protein
MAVNLEAKNLRTMFHGAGQAGRDELCRIRDLEKDVGQFKATLSADGIGALVARRATSSSKPASAQDVARPLPARSCSGSTAWAPRKISGEMRYVASRASGHRDPGQRQSLILAAATPVIVSNVTRAPASPRSKR